jgi:alkaline phosphatase D
MCTCSCLLGSPSILIAQNVETLTFGSCAKQYLPQPIWESILQLKPEVFVFLGDNIYGDTTDMEKLRSKYQQLGAIAGFQKLKQNTTILATWDDHDYGQNDAGAEFSQKEESQQIFLDFFDEPSNSTRRKTPGIYDARMIGEKGKRVQFLLLDTRYFRSQLYKPGRQDNPVEGRWGPYQPNPDPSGTLLGEAQWKWLEEQLKQPAELRILATSIQLVADEHGWECWANFPHERQRLYQLIHKTRANGIIAISGDRHRAEISKDDQSLPYPLFDITASGMNMKSRFSNEINSHRVGSPYQDEHFGSVLIDWETGNLTLQIRNLNGTPIIQAKTSLENLAYPNQ